MPPPKPTELLLLLLVDEEDDGFAPSSAAEVAVSHRDVLNVALVSVSGVNVTMDAAAASAGIICRTTSRADEGIVS